MNKSREPDREQSVLRIAMLGLHSQPSGVLGTRKTGGMSVYIRMLAAGLGCMGHLVDIITLDESITVPVAERWSPQVELVRLPLSASCLPHGQQQDIVTSLADPAGLAAAIVAYARQAGHRYDLVHSNYYLSGLVGAKLAALEKLPHAVTFHTLAVAKMTALSGHQESASRLAAEASLARECHGIFAATNHEQVLMNNFIRDKRSQIYRVPCGVDTRTFTPQTCEKTTDLLAVGRFDPMKGFADLLWALAAMDNDRVRLTLVGGDGPDSPEHLELQQLAVQLGLQSRVFFLGPVAHEEMAGIYNRSLAVVVPSRYESFGLVALEALACGRPVAACRTGVAGEIIVAGENGSLAQPGDHQGLAKAMSEALELAGRDRYEEIRRSVLAYDWQQVTNLLLAAYVDLVNAFHLGATPAICGGTNEREI